MQEKLFEELPIEERIKLFKKEFNLAEKYPAQTFFDWHNKLTGSCLMGRQAFVKNKGIDMEKSYTVAEFIAYCEDDYGGDIIKELKEALRNE